MPAPIVFFCRCRPQNSDAIEIALETNRVFIGYPAWRKGKFELDHSFHSAIVNLGATQQDNDVVAAELSVSWRRQIAVNRNLVREAGNGSIVLLPRPARGLVYAGRTVGFELVDEPPWGERYLSLRKEQGLEVKPRGSHLADVVQGWKVEKWHSVPFPAIPVWIRASLFGRSTIGRIKPIRLPGLELDPLVELDRVIKNPARVWPPRTSDVEEIAKRLVTYIGPNSFEHLVVALLQLERPEEMWSHIAGSGDGGVDGIGANRDGRVVGLLQCKWRYDGSKLDFENSTEETDPNIKRYVASLLHPADLAEVRSTILLDRLSIARLVLKHVDKLPWAQSMQIGH